MSGKSPTRKGPGAVYAPGPFNISDNAQAQLRILISRRPIADLFHRVYELGQVRVLTIAVGLIIATYGTWLLCGINPSMSEGEIMLWTSIRAAGNALALMPIMTAGLAAIPPQFASSGSAFNNIAQRVSSSLGLAGLGVFVSNQQSR